MHEDSCDEKVVSCDAGLSRKEFLERVLTPALLAGAALASPKIVDKFILPAQAAPTTSQRKTTLRPKGGINGGPWPRRL
ncbi:MAG TPA: hypothetical protein V6D22_16065 [Candidatus Obscuribacterales bacterium]